MRLHPLLRLALIAVSIVPTLRADDLYVDALNGDNLNSGTSAGDAWLTLTHAVGHLPAGLYHTIHVALGTYNAGLGESFPIPSSPVSACARRALASARALTPMARPRCSSWWGSQALHFYRLTSRVFGSSTP